MVGWQYQLNGYEFEQALGDGEAQGSLECCSPWGRKESDMIKQLNNNIAATSYKIQNYKTHHLQEIPQHQVLKGI